MRKIGVSKIGCATAVTKLMKHRWCIYDHGAHFKEVVKREQLGAASPDCSRS